MRISLCCKVSVVRYPQFTIYIILWAIDGSLSFTNDCGYIVKSVSKNIIHRSSTTMASQEGPMSSASTTVQPHGDAYPHLEHGTDTFNSRTKCQKDSKHQGKGRGNGAAKHHQGGSKRKKEVGRAEYGYVNQSLSSMALALIHEAVNQAIEERATLSKLQND